MRISQLHIQRVRNLAEVHLALGPGLNLFLGPNGAGKTAVLEALHLLARGRSFRTPKLSDVLSRGSDDLLVRAEFVVGDSDPPKVVHAGLAKKLRGATELRVDGAKESRLSTLAKRVPLQVILPDASDLVFGGPAQRRQFLNWGVFHVEHRYGALWQQYVKVLRQRNALLKAAAPNQPYQGSEIQSWTEKLVQLGLAATDMRQRYFANWLPILRDTLKQLEQRGLEGVEGVEGEDAALQIEFDSGIPGINSVETVCEPLDTARISTEKRAKFLNLLSENYQREVKYGVTQVGPHRADIRLLAGVAPAGASLSRGQGKTLALAMMLSQAQYLMRETGDASVFLIDDVGAELDDANNHRFFRLLASTGCQILATTNEMPNFALGAPVGNDGGDAQVAVWGHQDIRVFHVKHGAAAQE